MSRLAPYRAHLILFVLGLMVFGATAASRLKRQSTDAHFAFLADAWLSGKVAIDPPPTKGDDWAIIETVELDDGSTVSGRRLVTRRNFRVAGGDEIPISRVRRTIKKTHHVSFPPFPAVLMVPQALISGPHANDVALTVFIAALCLPLFFALLRRLSNYGLSRRSSWEDAMLVSAFAFGTVFFFSAVQGRVWFTAHIVGVFLALAYAWCSIEARHPILAGLLLGLATMTRTPMAFMFPLFLLEAWRMAGGRKNTRDFMVSAAKFATPIVLIAVIAIIYNMTRFAEPTEFGHSYLAVRQQSQIETIGMFSHHYLSRNLAVLLALLPDLSSSAPYIKVSGHGMALWFSTPLLFFLLWPRDRGPLHRALWITVAAVAIPTLFYQNSGWFQFGPRFALDYLVFLFLLIAVGGRPFGKTARALVVCGIVINLFGAITFARHHQYYDAGTYNTVIKH